MKDHENFFKKALEIQAQKREKLSEAEKKEIAEQLGFSESDWQAVLDSFAAHFERGSEFLKRNNCEKAIAELEEALIIQPEHAPTLAALAQAYLGLYQTKKRSTQKEKALQYAQECLQYETKNEAAHQVIDFFNPNQIQTSKPSKPSSSKPSHPKHPTTKESPLWIMRPFMILMIIGAISFGIYNEWYLPSLKNKPYNAKTSTLRKKDNRAKLMESVKQKEIIPLDFAPLAPHLAAKGYELRQKDAKNWVLQTRNQVLLLAFTLTENEWKWVVQTPENNPNKKNEWDRYSATFRVNILCDSIQHNQLAFEFAAFDDLQAAKKPFFTSKNPIRLNAYVPDTYQYRAGSQQHFFLTYSSNELKAYQLKERDLGIPAKKIKLKILDFQTVVPEKRTITPLKISFEKNISDSEYLKIWQRKTTFFKHFNHWHQHLWQIEVENQHPQATIAELELQTLYWNKDKKLLRDEYHFLQGGILNRAIQAYDLFTELGEKTVKGEPQPIQASEVARYEIKVTRLVWK